MTDRFESLRTIPLFHSLGEHELRGIAALLIDRKFPKGATILEDGVGGDHMYVIQQGQVKVTKMSDEGREKILEILGEGDFFGEMALLDREPRSASVKTTRACVLLALSRGDFLSLLRRNTELSMELIRVLSRRLCEANEQVRGLLFERVEGRMRRVLNRLATDPVPDHPGRRTTPALTHQQLADLVGTSRETITRVLKELKGQGWLEQRGKCYHLPVSDA